MIIIQQIYLNFVMLAHSVPWSLPDVSLKNILKWI